jgi:hypothetical protein
MILRLIKAPPAVGAHVRTEPGLLDQLWNRAPVTDAGVATIDADADVMSEDYRLLWELVEEDQSRFAWMVRAINGIGETLDYECGYGPAFIVPAEQVVAVADGLVAEGWESAREYGETVAHGVFDFYAEAAANGKAIIGGVS